MSSSESLKMPMGSKQDILIQLSFPKTGATVVKAVPLADKFLENNNDLFASMPVFDSTAKRSDCVVS